MNGLCTHWRKVAATIDRYGRTKQTLLGSEYCFLLPLSSIIHPSLCIHGNYD